MWVTKASTVLISLIVLGISLWGNKSVLLLVALAWSILATAITPLLYIYIFKQPLTERQALTMMTIGAAVAIGWFWAGIDGLIWPSFPGFIAAGLIYLGFRLFNANKATS